MSGDQALILLLLAAALALFLWGRWRHDLVALAVLLAAVLLGLVPAEGAFTGFAHPAVVTVAALLILSRALQTSGALEPLLRWVLSLKGGPFPSLLALTGLGAFLSAFMNNVGALVLLMPAAVQLAGRLGLAPGQVLMPLAFGTILGGMTTLIGTPPNLVVSGFREGGFGLFAFTPVGLAVALAGLLFLSLLGWRLVPPRKPAGLEGFRTGAYFTEARVGKGKALGLTPGQLEDALGEAEVQVLGLVRERVRLRASPFRQALREGDILLLAARPEALGEVLAAWGLELAESSPAEEKEAGGRQGVSRAQEGPESRPEEEVLAELVVLPGSPLVGRSVREIRLRGRYGVNLLAVSRQEASAFGRLASLPLRTGDLLLVQGSLEAVSEFAEDYGCVPLAERRLALPDRRRALAAGLALAGAVLAVALGLLPPAIAFTLGALAAVALRALPLREVYAAVDWPVVVLLGALIPVAQAVEATGAGELLARSLLHLLQDHPFLSLALILVLSMLLSDLMSNAATALVMSPLALETARALGASADPFLMAVAVGASCAFLTPIGHQNNALILGPGGFRFGDYWRLGLPLEALVVGVALLLLTRVWPL
ncbi:SLC13 family permease [Thermus thermamylovorans]|uniref:SLC13 family permease n=1 Tax=Thermus thermamylovorans TaxID=2509362 RepID=A0A4Q9B5S3_9DEIN|nr:SLC13 family permease [Thermus thermamylovorans]TBH20973.1 SLC13 family permease [Thermus thermamylovorans]